MSIRYNKENIIFTDKQKLQTLLNSEKEFEKYIIQLLENSASDSDFDNELGVPILEYGADDGYYWERTIIKLENDNKLTVTFDEGSGSGWIECELIEYSVTIEEFRQYLLNRKWENSSIDTVNVLVESIKKIGNVVRDLSDDAYWGY